MFRTPDGFYLNSIDHVLKYYQKQKMLPNFSESVRKGFVTAQQEVRLSSALTVFVCHVPPVSPSLSLAAARQEVQNFIFYPCFVVSRRFQRDVGVSYLRQCR